MMHLINFVFKRSDQWVLITLVLMCIVWILTKQQQAMVYVSGLPVTEKALEYVPDGGTPVIRTDTIPFPKPCKKVIAKGVDARVKVVPSLTHPRVAFEAPQEVQECVEWFSHADTLVIQKKPAANYKAWRAEFTVHLEVPVLPEYFYTEEGLLTVIPSASPSINPEREKVKMTRKNITLEGGPLGTFNFIGTSSYQELDSVFLQLTYAPIRSYIPMSLSGRANHLELTYKTVYPGLQPQLVNIPGTRQDFTSLNASRFEVQSAHIDWPYRGELILNVKKRLSGLLRGPGHCYLLGDPEIELKRTGPGRILRVYEGTSR